MAADGSYPPRRTEPATEALPASTVHTLTLSGLDAEIVTVTAAIVSGGGRLEIMGLSDPQARETRIRVRAALTVLALGTNDGSIRVELAPHGSPKGAAVDVAVALAVLLAHGRVPAASFQGTVVLGELSLGGDLLPTRGVLPMLQGAARLGLARAIVPAANGAEAAHARGVTVGVASDLRELVVYLRTGTPLAAPSAPRNESPAEVDLSDVRGCATGRRALEVAAAGGHDLFLLAPPGAGSTMLARRLTTVLPPLAPEEALEVTALHSVSGLLEREQGRVTSRPFRAPHHTVSMAGLVGGGDPVRPGEVSLSHQGVLFLESLHEFRRNVVDELGRALTASRSRLVRGGKSVSFPASTLVVASAALCPCGSKGAARDTCGCSPERVHAFLDRMKGPVFDRFDVRVVLPADEVGGLKTPPGESSQVVRERVVRARVVQAARARKYGVATVNARLTSAELDLVAAPDLAASRLLANAADRLRLTSEECSRVLRVARTLADLEGRDVVRALHLAEAVLLTAGLREARAR